MFRRTKFTKAKFIMLCIGVFLVLRFVPFSINGPAMSCLSVHQKTKLQPAVREFSEANGNQLRVTTKFLTNSGFSLRHVVPVYEAESSQYQYKKKENYISLVFTSGHDLRCFPLNFVIVDEPWVVIETSTDLKSEHYGRVISVN